MLLVLAAFLLAGGPAPSSNPVDLGGTAWIVSTIGHSEFCPAGNVRIDLRTGQYTFTTTAPRKVCNDTGLERPVSAGKLNGERLAAARAGYARAVAEGLIHQACREGRQPETLIVSNGGTPVLVLTTGRQTGSAPDDLSCWSQAASALHQVLDDLFNSTHQP